MSDGEYRVDIVEKLFNGIPDFKTNNEAGHEIQILRTELAELKKERDELQAKLDGGIRVDVYGSIKIDSQSQIEYGVLREYTNATLILDKGVEL